MLTQVFLHKRFASVSETQYTIEKNFISFMFSGLEFLIEYNGNECQIDIMVRSTKESVETWSIVEDCVLKPTREFCASPTEGCQGVVLIEGILRPLCVQELWVRRDREDQCLGVEELKQKVLATGKLNYEHHWKKGMSGFPPAGVDKAKDMLGLENWEDVLNRRLNILEKLDGEVNVNSINNKDGQSLQRQGSLNPNPKHRVSRTVSLLPRPAEMTGQLIQDRVHNRVEEITALQKRMFPEISRNLYKVINFPFLLQDNRIPHLVYLSTGGDSVKGERLVTKLIPGSYSRKLHLMCEHRDGIHMIDNQIGGIMRCDEKSVKSVRPHMLWGLKLISMLMRTGELAAGGFTSMVTESERMILMGLVSGSEPESEKFEETMDFSGSFRFTPEEMMAAEDWLINYMKGKNVAALFNLFKVVYLADDGKPSKDVAWVCEKHMNYGVHRGTMQVLPV